MAPFSYSCRSTKLHKNSFVTEFLFWDRDFVNVFIFNNTVRILLVSYLVLEMNVIARYASTPGICGFDASECWLSKQKKQTPISSSSVIQKQQRSLERRLHASGIRQCHDIDLLILLWRLTTFVQIISNHRRKKFHKLLSYSFVDYISGMCLTLVTSLWHDSELVISYTFD